jgi:hypothetical protein
MLLRFKERIALPAAVVYSYFRTPEDWVRLYGAFGEVSDEGEGWRAVHLRHFPWPLVAKITEDEPDRRVKWEFRGFWQGEGEISFEPVDEGVLIEGYEQISPAGLRFLAPLAERLFLERRFRGIWALGFRRLRKEAARQRAAA